MDLFATQQSRKEAIAFAEWIYDNDYDPCGDMDDVRWENDRTNAHPTATLYDLYTQSLNQVKE